MIHTFTDGDTVTAVEATHTKVYTNDIAEYNADRGGIDYSKTADNGEKIIGNALDSDLGGVT